MRIHKAVLAAALFVIIFSASARADSFSATFLGTITDITTFGGSNTFLTFAVGQTVTGSYIFDSSNLSNRSFNAFANGVLIDAYSAFPNGLNMVFDANRLPVGGNAAGSFDLHILPDGVLEFTAGPGPSATLKAKVTYSQTAVPELASAWLLCAGLLGILAVYRRRFRYE